MTDQPLEQAFESSWKPGQPRSARILSEARGRAGKDSYRWMGLPQAFGERGGSSGSAGGVEGLPVPRQEFGDAPRRVVGNAGEHVGEIVLRVEAVELGALDQ
jgi:hypothetical protein